MKTIILFTFSIFLLLLSETAISQETTNQLTSPKQATSTVMCTPDLYELAAKWVSEYNSINPEIALKLVTANFNSPELIESENLGFISNKSQAIIGDSKTWKMAVGHDVIVPIFNAGNTFLSEINQQGISPEDFKQIITSPQTTNWGDLLSIPQKNPIHIYIVEDESIQNNFSKFLNLTQFPSNSIISGNKDEVVAAIQKDIYAIGICKMSDILLPSNQGMAENIRLLPVDKNGNGTLDYMEDIYTDANTFMHGVWIGKYPKALYSNLYVVSNMSPTNKTELDFLSWVLTDGQKHIISSGFSELAGNESLSQLNKINITDLKVMPAKDNASSTILIVITALLIIGLIIGVLIRNFRKQGNVLPDLHYTPQSFSEDTVQLPKGIYFNKSHTWAFMEKDGSATIGVDDFLQHLTGPITRIDMKNPGTQVRKGDPLFSIIQSGKQLIMYAPVSGTIKQQNEALINNSTLLNSSPYSEGWVYKLEPSNWINDIRLMDMADKYIKWIENEFIRVKDFMAATLNPGSIQYSHIVMQDGGLLKEGALADCSPEVWEDFQSDFLDIYK